MSFENIMFRILPKLGADSNGVYGYVPYVNGGGGLGIVPARSKGSASLNF